MHLHGPTLAFLLPSSILYAANSVIATPSAIASSADLFVRDPSYSDLTERPRSGVNSPSRLLYVRDGDEHDHGHGHGHMAPIVQLNETEVLLYHAPTPPSYWTVDIDEHDSGNTRHPGLMALHALFMMLAFFGALPAGLPCHAPSSLPF
jgi:hypothetical protein